MISQNTLETYCDQIETRLTQLNKPVVILDGNIFPSAGFIELILDPKTYKGKMTTVDALLDSGRDIANAVSNPQVRVYQNSNAKVCVEIQISEPIAPTMKELSEAVQQKYQLVLGKKKDGNPLFFNLKEPAQAHLLVAGMTGSGKTALCHSILINATQTHFPQELKIAVIDYNNVDQEWLFDKIQDHIKEIPSNVTEAANLLKQIATKMFENKNPYKVLVFIDELAGLCSESTEALKAIEVIAQQGRKYGVHLIAATQKPAAAVIGSLMKSNMRRCVGKVSSPEDSKVATGIAGVGCESLSGNGQFIFVDSQLIRFQSALPEDFGVVKFSETTSGDLLDFSTTSKGITIENCMGAIHALNVEGKEVNRKNVLERLGYKQAGGASRKINTIWDQITSISTTS